MKIRLLKSKTRNPVLAEKGIVLPAILIFTLIFTILGFSMLNLAADEIVLTQNDINRTKAFYLAEAGLSLFTAKWGQVGAAVNINDIKDIEDTVLGMGSYRVVFYENEDPPYAVATGIVGNKEKKIKVEVSFLAAPYENAIYASSSGGEDWTLALRGKGNPQSKSGRSDLFSSDRFGGEYGGRDVINGNIYVDRDVILCEESGVNPAPTPNTYGLNGDVDATGNITVLDSASISGSAREGAALEEAPDLRAMNYRVNNTHNVSQIFIDEGIDEGYLPAGHELRDVIVKNPSNRSEECASTANDDYYLEPRWVTRAGRDYKDAATPLNLGENRVYYIDGDVWVHHPGTYGFLVDGNVTIVATGDIHISDNIAYADSKSVLGLVALGKYNDEGQLVNGGNVYFGDPRYGTTYKVSGLMFAANSFLY
ncbi:MAG: pilus assembly PilX N-terminal domain-containing protein, partial [Dehalococcoidia bacterium]